MPTSAISADDTRGRREIILDATLRVIGTGGVDSVTHRRVAAEARVPLGSIAYYFDSRDELIGAAFRHHMNEVRDTVRSVARQGTRPTTDTLVDAMVRLSRDYVGRGTLQHAEFEMYVYAARHPAIAEEMDRWQVALAAPLAEALERLGVDRPIEAARSVQGVIRGFELERLIRPDAGFDELRNRIETVLAGLQSHRTRRRTRTPARRAATR